MTVSSAGGHRIFSRVPFSAACSLQVSGQSFAVSLLDIALKGALVFSEVRLSLTLHAPCRLVLPLSDGGEAIIMNGRVAHLDADNQHVGMACEDIDLMSLTRLRRLLELNTGDAELMDRELVQLFSKR